MDSNGSERVVRGKWDDLESAALVAASACEMAVEDVSGAGRGQLTFRLLTIREEPAVIACRALDPGAPEDQTAEITVRAKVGRFGDAQRERALLDVIERRLRVLAERGFGPIRR